MFRCQRRTICCGDELDYWLYDGANVVLLCQRDTSLQRHPSTWQPTTRSADAAYKKDASVVTLIFAITSLHLFMLALLYFTFENPCALWLVKPSDFEDLCSVEPSIRPAPHKRHTLANPKVTLVGQCHGVRMNCPRDSHLIHGNTTISSLCRNPKSETRYTDKLYSTLYTNLEDLGLRHRVFGFAARRHRGCLINGNLKGRMTHNSPESEQAALEGVTVQK